MKISDFLLSPAPRGSGWTDDFHPSGSVLGKTFPIQISFDQIALAGDLTIPPDAKGVVLFAHGHGSSRHSPRNQLVARMMQESGIATLLFDFFTRAEITGNAADGRRPFDIHTLATRLVGVSRWVANQSATCHLGIGYFGASTGGAVALVAAAELGSEVDVVVSRGGRPDLAGTVLSRVLTPTLMIVGAQDELVHDLNRKAFEHLAGKKRLALIPRATHLFEEPGAMEQVAKVATAWVRQYLKPR